MNSALLRYFCRGLYGFCLRCRVKRFPPSCPFDRLVVEAKDRGHPALSETCIVQVQIVDVNDNRPVISAVEPLAVPESKISENIKRSIKKTILCHLT